MKVKNIKIYLPPLIMAALMILVNANTSRATSVDSSLYYSTPTYIEIIERYIQMDSASNLARLIEYGETDGGNKLHLFVISKSGLFDPALIHNSGNTIFFINNGIHPGEPDGINASIILAQHLIENGGKNIPENVTICILPVMNIEGSINRSCCSRVNQNGPPEYGFRANGLYLDLNRDFIKADSRIMKSWINIFREWDPSVFIDTHVSDGADYQYTMTLISSQHNKLYPIQGNFMQNTFTPGLFRKMKEKKSEMCPYVDTFSWDLPPDSGIVSFLETPRFATGYAALFNCYGFISESHMLKPFRERVKATGLILESLLELCEQHHVEIEASKVKARDEDIHRRSFPLNFVLDKTKSENLSFKGYEHGYKKSDVTKLNRLYYDRGKPFERNIPYYRHYKAVDTITAPEYYLIPQEWTEVISLLSTSHIQMKSIQRDSSCSAEVYYIKDFTTSENPFEGHYLHQQTKVEQRQEMVEFKKGDKLVPVHQVGSRYIIETLEPISLDSYFNWGFFDAILQQKEWFSAYAFEDLAISILAENESLKVKFEELQKTDKVFAEDSFAQLYFIYKNSKYFEKGFKRYPVLRLN